MRELGLLGKLTVRASMEALPALADLDPERCYVAWEMTLATAAGLDAIRDVFIFVEDTCELSVEPGGDIAAAAAPTAEMSEAERTARALMEKRATPGRRNYDKPDDATSLRVPAAKLDQFVNLVGELVTVQAHLSELSGRREDAEVTAVSEEIEGLTSALRENSMNIRMMPIRGTFEKFRRLVHDLARDLGKDVELTIEGAETELDKTVIEQLSDPLMHLIRNSMDHGIEPAADRAGRGKPSTARIRLAARHSGASVLVSVSDDGRGIDSAAVRAVPSRRAWWRRRQLLEEKEIFALIFQPGFSTALQVTDVSGRGVGMDVVRQRVESLRGTIDVASNPGIGNQRDHAAAPDHGHHRRAAGDRGRGMLCAAHGLDPGMHRADARRHRARQRQAPGQRCAGRLFPTSVCASTFTWPQRGPRSSRSCWWKPARAELVLWWTKCWAIARR